MKGYIITIDASRPIDDVAKDLADAGLRVGLKFAEFGVISGDMDEKDVPKMKAIKGVTDVSLDPAIAIGPPGVGLTW